MSTALKTGQVDVSLYYRAYKISDGSEETGLAYNTAGLSLVYVREREAPVAATVGSSPAPVTLAAATTAHTDWGFKQIDGNLYRVDWPDAAFITGAKFVVPKPKLSGYTFILEPLVDLIGADPRSATVDAQVKGMDANVVTASALATDAATEIANAVVEKELDALETYNRSSDTAGTITGPNGSRTLTMTTNSAYNPIKSIS